MQLIAYARNKVIIKDSDMDMPTLWNQRMRLNNFAQWRVTHGPQFSTSPAALSTIFLQYKDEYTHWKRGKLNFDSYTVFNDEAQFISWRHTFANQALIDGFKRLIDDKFPDKASFRSTLSNTYDILLFEAQHATLLQLFWKKIKNAKG